MIDKAYIANGVLGSWVAVTAYQKLVGTGEKFVNSSDWTLCTAVGIVGADYYTRTPTGGNYTPHLITCVAFVALVILGTALRIYEFVILKDIKYRQECQRECKKTIRRLEKYGLPQRDGQDYKKKLNEVLSNPLLATDIFKMLTKITAGFSEASEKIPCDEDPYKKTVLPLFASGFKHENPATRAIAYSAFKKLARDYLNHRGPSDRYTEAMISVSDSFHKAELLSRRPQATEKLRAVWINDPVFLTRLYSSTKLNIYDKTYYLTEIWQSFQRRYGWRPN